MLKSMVIFFPFACLVHRTTQVVLTEQDRANPAIRCKDLERPHCDGASGIFEMVCKSLCCTQFDSLQPPHEKNNALSSHQRTNKSEVNKKGDFFHAVFCLSCFSRCLSKRQNTVIKATARGKP